MVFRLERSFCQGVWRFLFVPLWFLFIRAIRNTQTCDIWKIVVHRIMAPSFKKKSSVFYVEELQNRAIEFQFSPTEMKYYP